MRFISGLFRWLIDTDHIVAVVILGVLLIAGGLALILYLKNPFSFPYYTIKVDVTGARNIDRGDIIDRTLSDSRAREEIEKNEKYVKDWRIWCRERIEKSPFKKHRKIQYEKILPAKDETYRFELYRNLKRYRQVNYERYGYRQDVFVGSFTTGMGEMKVRYRELKRSGFNGTLGEQDRAKQRSLMTPELRRRIAERDNYTCQICGRYMPDGVGLQIDHIIPVAKGGKTTPDNLQVLCAECNRKKSDRVR